ncbi:MAG TPA: aryl-sulfate sulfotransferase [Alphaproteobacteria bacterium]|jgi:predicted DNA-binding ribbon-helix-helix protein|nr:aryl-sulfate sulfotransferase [Rhodospirillaceae bacterium]MBL6625996.1 ribbon-helix-helix domain-containing protein [Alphaproteobacteria bacterium]HAO58629.1 aryl-sulfate sulfotransferase [Alphaproteobacteria bacterium]HBD53193.1 aryl-sulfate sulfotransferase [Alphaproteobacteria bacterium]HBP57991.1 aryl-sulfate sulfotransferase [Alphaproteobacteria bacterium]|tara:strand:- start:4624 stop:4860 length:237 start_codon:yes stop_codon:yes gene_type:complete
MKKRSVSIRGHRTSLSLEDPFWDELLLLANESGTSVAGLITEIDKNRQAGLSSAVRIFVLQTLKQKAAACRTVSGVTD